MRPIKRHLKINIANSQLSKDHQSNFNVLSAVNVRENNVSPNPVTHVEHIPELCSERIKIRSLFRKEEVKFIVPKKQAIKKAINWLVPPPINPENDYQSMCKNKFIM